MRISQEADYSLRIVSFLSEAGEDGKCDAKTIAEKTSLPQRFAVKILRKLNLAGITKSYRGAYGGYAVNRNPKNITFLDVVQCIDGPLCINKCLGDVDACSDKRNGDCMVHRQLKSINQTICKMLKEANFGEITKE